MNPPNYVPSRKEIEALKKEWEEDPCWDLVDTEGFESCRNELAAHQAMIEESWKKKANDERQQEELELAAEFAELGELGVYRVLKKAMERIEDLEAQLSELEGKLAAR